MEELSRVLLRHVITFITLESILKRWMKSSRRGNDDRQKGVVMNWTPIKIGSAGVGVVLVYLSILAGIVAFWATLIYFGVKLVRHAWGG